MLKDSRIYVAGNDSLVGSAIVRRLRQQGYSQLVGANGTEPDLRDAAAVNRFFAQESPEIVFLAAGQSGGIAANQRYPADLMVDNLLTAVHVIQAAFTHHVSKLLYLASSCIYPKHSPQPMRIENLMTGPLESTNEAYATAKIAGLKLCEAYRSQFGANFITVIPANPFGLGDSFDPENAHVIGALMHRMSEAIRQGSNSVEIWGTGNPRREFIFADDLADACIFTMNSYDRSVPLNIGSGEIISIKELALLIRDVIGYTGEIIFDASRPDGMPFKALDSTRLSELGWRPQTPLRVALSAMYQWYLQTHQGDLRHV